MANLALFDFEGQPIRIEDRDGNPWFALTDVCRALAIEHTGTAARRIDPEDKGVVSMHTVGGPQDLNVINESGLWSLVLTSRKPEAKRLKRWVTSEVLPQIRKTGSYGPAPQIDVRDHAQLSQITLQLIEVKRELEQRVREQAVEIRVLTPKADALDRIAGSDGLTLPSVAAKTLGLGPREFIERLIAGGFAYRRNRTVVPAQPFVDKGVLALKARTFMDRDGFDRTSQQLYVTAKGLAYFGKKLASQPGAVHQGELGLSVNPAPSSDEEDGPWA